jgi:heme-degrading monooxygenase HmoA
MWEARLAHDCRPDASLLPGGCDVYASYDGPARVVVLSHWADEGALAAYAGSSWRLDARAEAAAFGDAIAADPHVWHFTRLS